MGLDELGTRICILGPSNSGKSTLAQAIGDARDLTAVHLDQLRHLPRTKFVLRPDDEFEQLHDAAIEGERWVIEGNYSSLLPQRLARATGLILMDCSAPLSLVRYFRRTLLPSRRIGGLGVGETINWGMIQYIAQTAPKNRQRYLEIFHEATMPAVYLGDRRQISTFYESERLRLSRRR